MHCVIYIGVLGGIISALLQFQIKTIYFKIKMSSVSGAAMFSTAPIFLLDLLDT